MLGSGDAKFKVYKVRFKWPIFISVSPVHSLDDGACHKHNLVGPARLFDGASSGPSGSLLVGSGPACRLQGFSSDYQMEFK